MRAWVLLGCLLFAPSAAAQDYQAALEAERTALEAEQASLERALESAEASGRSAEAALESEVERLTAQLARARAENTTRVPQLGEGERMRSLENETRRADQLKSRARAWLKTEGATVAETAPIDALVGSALDIIARQGRLRVDSGEYFNADGRAHQEPLLRVGPVAAVALGRPAQPLVLAADGSLRSEPGLEIQPPKRSGDGVILDVVLFDPEDATKLARVAPGGVWAWLERGGPVMWPLVVLGLLAALIALERTFALVRASLKLRSLERLGLGSPSAWGPASERTPARSALTGALRQPGFLAPLILVSSPEEPLVGLEERAIDALRKSRSRLRRGLFFVGVVAAASPLIGLLGTVTGMISTFAVITEHGTGDPRLLSAGISEALLTTQLGLTVAVPALLANALLLRGAQRVLARLETLAVDVLAARRKAADP